jgi:hypothetical protein
MQLKYKRVSSYIIETIYDDTTIRIGKDYGSHGRCKPFYYVESDNKVIMHGFTTQKEAKKYVLTQIGIDFKKAV